MFVNLNSTSDQKRPDSAHRLGLQETCVIYLEWRPGLSTYGIEK